MLDVVLGYLAFFFEGGEDFIFALAVAVLAQAGFGDRLQFAANDEFLATDSASIGYFTLDIVDGEPEVAALLVPLVVTVAHGGGDEGDFFFFFEEFVLAG